jgi:hypothetical protein
MFASRAALNGFTAKSSSTCLRSSDAARMCEQICGRKEALRYNSLSGSVNLHSQWDTSSHLELRGAAETLRVVQVSLCLEILEAPGNDVSCKFHSTYNLFHKSSITNAVGCRDRTSSATNWVVPRRQALLASEPDLEPGGVGHQGNIIYP